MLPRDGILMADLGLKGGKSLTDFQSFVKAFIGKVSFSSRRVTCAVSLSSRRAMRSSNRL